MDILHHAAIGIAGAMALAAAGEPLASAAFLTASILPDADVAVMARSKRTFLKAHQSATPSLPVAAGLSAFLAAIATWHFGAGPGISAGVAFFAGLAIHVLLDASNTLGTWLLWPFGSRLRLDAVFFIDALSSFQLNQLSASKLPWHNCVLPSHLGPLWQKGKMMFARRDLRASSAKFDNDRFLFRALHPIWDEMETIFSI